MTDFATKLQAVRLALGELASCTDHPDLPELFADANFIAPDVIAQLLMEYLPIEGMGFANKAFWLAVAEHMGPDYIESFRKVGGFMNKINEF